MTEMGTISTDIYSARALTVVENYNGVNDYIRFGKRGELASNRREE